MADTWYRFSVGSIACTVVSDFSRERQDPFTSPFVGVDDATFRAAADDWLASTTDPRNVVGFNCLVVDTGQHRVLIDTGLGEDSPQGGLLFEHLAAAGIAPESIDVVVLTHAHGDHLGGLRRASGGLGFPNARYVISRPEWSHWMSDPEDASAETRARFEQVREQLAPLGERLAQVAIDAKIAPGLRAVPAQGHSPGMMALRVESGAERLLFMADIVHTPLQFAHPDWYLPFDHDPQNAVRSRRSVFSQAAGGLAMAYHFPFPGLGRVVPAGDVWRWLPVTE